MHLTQYYGTRLHQASEEATQRVLWAKFTAKYLPSLVDRLLNLPPQGAQTPCHGAEDYPIQNIYHTTLKFTDPAYLAKFMASSRPIAEGSSPLVYINLQSWHIQDIYPNKKLVSAYRQSWPSAWWNLLLMRWRDPATKDVFIGLSQLSWCS